jgi:hypothetical protein
MHNNTISPSPGRRADGVHNRADSGNPVSEYMRHRVRWSRREGEEIGASMQTLQRIHEGVPIPFKNNRPHPRFNQGVSLLDATPAQLELVDRGASSLRPSRGLGALDMQQLRLHTLPNAQAGIQPVAANLRPTTIKQALLRTKATRDGNATRSEAPNEKRRLHV